MDEYEVPEGFPIPKICLEPEENDKDGRVFATRGKKTRLAIRDIYSLENVELTTSGLTMKSPERWHILHKHLIGDINTMRSKFLEIEESYQDPSNSYYLLPLQFNVSVNSGEKKYKIFKLELSKYEFIIASIRYLRVARSDGKGSNAPCPSKPYGDVEGPPERHDYYENNGELIENIDEFIKRSPSTSSKIVSAPLLLVKVDLGDKKQEEIWDYGPKHNDDGLAWSGDRISRANEEIYVGHFKTEIQRCKIIGVNRFLNLMVAEVDGSVLVKICSSIEQNNGQRTLIVHATLLKEGSFPVFVNEKGSNASVMMQRDIPVCIDADSVISFSRDINSLKNPATITLYKMEQ